MRMKKVFHVLKKVLKWYVILDVIILAIIGCGEIADRSIKYPDESWTEMDINVWNSALAKIKKIFV